MKLKIALSTATALGLLIGGAYAGSNNESYLDQVGDRNSASITQGQTNGSAVGNRAGFGTLRMLQNGADNELIVNQTHDSAVNSAPRNQINRVGNPGDQAGLGIDQIGNGNYLRIDQTGANQAVFEVQQNGGTSATTDSNNATITQSGGYSARVSNLRQTFTGGAADESNDVTITQTGQSSRVGNTSSGPRSDGSGATQNGFGNALTINQTSNAQLVYTATQNGADNAATITQGGGNGNQLRELAQDNTGAAGNVATLTFSGAGNGVISGVFNSAALSVGVSQSRARQVGAGNNLSYVATGSDNLFGFVQDGVGNAIGGTATGTAHQAAILQDGDGNVSNFQQGGTGSNNLGIKVVGSDNVANANQGGSGNNVSTMTITGDDNDIDTGQSGANTVTTTVTGNNNLASIQQNQQNTATLTINGDDNNRAGFTPGGAAANLAAQGGVGLVAGLIVQEGFGNQFTLNVGSLTPSDANQFAARQNGNGNAITGTVNGDGNQAIVVQLGSTNTTSFTQTGGNNLVSVQQ